MTDTMKDSAFLQGVHHAYAQTDGTYAWPNSREGDLLRQAKREIDSLTLALKTARAETLEEVLVGLRSEKGDHCTGEVPTAD